MPDHLAVQHTVAFVERHGYGLLFWWVLVEQSALPIPSAPLLLAAGALIRTGRLHVLPAIASCAIAALIADTFWFQLGRRRGRRVLRLLCRVSLEPDSCVRQTENAFLKYGMNSLPVAKFIPGLNAVSAPMAGSSGRSYWQFLLFDTTGACIWSRAYFAAGYLISEQLGTMLAYVSRMGSGLFLLVAAAITLWIGRKFVQRRRFLKQLDVARITPEELRDRLNAGEDLYNMSLEDLSKRSQEIPRDREFILFCS
jgi:membrane protein DedA with SNARE-associated domain